MLICLGGVYSFVRFQPKTLYLFSAAAEGLVRAWDLNTSKPLRTLSGHVSNTRGMGFDRDGKRMVTYAD